MYKMWVLNVEWVGMVLRNDHATTFMLNNSLILSMNKINPDPFINSDYRIPSKRTISRDTMNDKNMLKFVELKDNIL